MVTKMKGVIWMKKESLFSIILLVLFIFILIGCAKEEVSTVLEEQNQIISVAVKVDFINNETLEDLKAKGLIINDTEQSKTYGNVVFGKINKSKVGDLPGEVKEGVSEREYKTEVLKEIAIEYNPNWKQNPRDLGLLIQSQIVTDEKKKELGVIGPTILGSTKEKFEMSQYITVVIFFRIEEWQNWEQHRDELSSELGDNIQIERAGPLDMTAKITEEGFKKLDDKEFILSIGIR